jgi:1-phosphatidylinositol phosphodiesterase
MALTACGGPPSSQDPGWMGSVADTAMLSQLSIPGTHESASLYEPLAGTAKCQNLNLSQQLDIGVRYFDIRCRDLNDAFAIYHGPESEMQDFDQVLAAMFGYLDAHPAEAVMMSIKEEGSEQGTTQSFEATFDGYVANNPDRWYLGASVPALGDVRGKIVLVRRFAVQTPPLGIDASGWQDNATFTLADADAKLTIEDAYMVTSDDTKWSEITTALAAARAAPSSDSTLFLTYTSGYQTKGGVPDVPAVATVIDPMLETYLEDPAAANAHLGVIAMDFVDGGHATKIVATNQP